MTTTTETLVATPRLPSVNLLPGEITERKTLRRAQLAMGAIVVAAAGAVGGLYVVAHHGVTDAQQQLDTAQAQGAKLRHQVANLQHVSQVYAQVDAQQALLTKAMSPEIRWSRYLNDLSLRVPDNVWVTQMDAKEGTTGSSAATPGTANGIGSITYTGVAFTHDDLAVWLESLAQQKGYTDPYFSNSTEAEIGGRKVVNFTSTVSLTPDALSGRYTKPVGG